MMGVPGGYGADEVDGGAAGWSPDELSEPTGRYVVTLVDDLVGDEEAMRAALRSVAGVSDMVPASELSESAVELQVGESDAVLFPDLGVAVVAGEQGSRLESLTVAAAEDERIEAVEPERTVHALQQPGVLAAEYLRGYRDAAAELYEHANGHDGGGVAVVEAAPLFADTPALTWGLQATGVATSPFSGQGVPIAMLDTGFDQHHPDFAGRPLTSRSFIPNQVVQDGHGHGTHVTGTSSGPQRPPTGVRRYGIACNDNIVIGKVLNNHGTGIDAQILAGIEWALTNRCLVVSLSLAADVHTVSQMYEAVGRRALAQGCLIVAAAGNRANRSQGNVGFVGVPANSPSIMAVGAVDTQLRIANFSVRSNPMVGGQVDIVGPGVDVFSSWSTTSPPIRLPDPAHRSINGTSMATPHVAAIAALWSQATGATGSALWALLARTAQRLPLPSVDVGAGLAQAPQR